MKILVAVGMLDINKKIIFKHINEPEIRIFRNHKKIGLNVSTDRIRKKKGGNGCKYTGKRLILRNSIFPQEKNPSKLIFKSK